MATKKDDTLETRELTPDEQALLDAEDKALAEEGIIPTPVEIVAETPKKQEPVLSDAQVNRLIKDDSKKMARVLEAQDKVEIVIPLEHGEKAGEATLYVNCNGYEMHIPKGTRQRVPAQVAELVLESLGINSQVHEQFSLANRAQDSEAKKALNI